MKLHVKYDGKWNALPCGDGDKPISWIVDEMKSRFKLIAGDITCNVLLSNGSASELHKADLIKSVLKDQDFVYLGKKKTKDFVHSPSHVHIARFSVMSFE